MEKSAARDYRAMLSARLLIRLVGAVRGFLVAGVLGPADYGLLTAVRMVSMLDKYGSLGFRQVAVREASYQRGAGESEREQQAKDNAFSSELVLTAAILAACLGGAFLADSAKVSWSIAIAGCAVAFSRVSGIPATEAVIEKKFVLLARATGWSEVLMSLLIILTVSWGRTYAVLAFPIVGHVAVLLWLGARTDYTFRFRIERDELIRQLRVGIPLTLNSLAYGSYRYAERIAVLYLFGVRELGFYGLATSVMQGLMMILLTGITVRKVTLLEDLGKKRYETVHRMVVRETAVHLGVAVILILPLWLALDLFVPRILPSYASGLLVIKLLPVACVFRNISPFLNAVLVSPLVNKQNYLAPLQFFSTLVFLGGCLVLKGLGLATLPNVVLLDIGGYAVYHLACPVLYKKYFYNPFVAQPSSAGAES